METPAPQLTREQKREQRLQRWLNPPGVKFRDARAEKLYKERVTRFMKAFLCEEPDRVPVMVPAGNFPLRYSSLKLKQAMYDHTVIAPAWSKFMGDFYDDIDDFLGPAGITCGRMLEILDYKSYKWPGHGLSDDVEYQQYDERVLMSEDEYDDLLRDPSDFGFRVITPRVVGALEVLKTFPPMSALIGMPMMLAYPFARPDVREAFSKLIEAGKELERFQQTIGSVMRDAVAAGVPISMGGPRPRPFDMI